MKHRSPSNCIQRPSFAAAVVHHHCQLDSVWGNPVNTPLDVCTRPFPETLDGGGKTSPDWGGGVAPCRRLGSQTGYKGERAEQQRPSLSAS